MSEITEGDRVEHAFEETGIRQGTVIEVLENEGSCVVEWDEYLSEDDRIWTMKLSCL